MLSPVLLEVLDHLGHRGGRLLLWENEGGSFEVVTVTGIVSCKVLNLGS